MLTEQTFDDVTQDQMVRQTVFDAIVKYRRMKNRGVVAVFKRDRFDHYSNFARIGQGSLGGKGRGLAFIDSIIKKNPEFDNFEGVSVQIPRTVVLCTDIFDEFMKTNKLYPIALSSCSDEEILARFLEASLPRRLAYDFYALFDVVDGPLAIRSSSLLEDSHYQPFAGIYSTYMIPHLTDKRAMLKQLSDAIKGVYASVFFTDSKAYMAATSNVIDQEKMAVIIQEVVGENHDGYYYPSFSGVGRSLNYYPVNEERAEAVRCNPPAALAADSVQFPRPRWNNRHLLSCQNPFLFPLISAADPPPFKRWKAFSAQCEYIPLRIRPSARRQPPHLPPQFWSSQG